MQRTLSSRRGCKCGVYPQRVEPCVLPYPHKRVAQPPLHKTTSHHHCRRIASGGLGCTLHRHHGAQHGLGTPERPHQAMIAVRTPHNAQ